MSISRSELLKQEIYKFNEWVKDNNVPISEAIVRHYEINGEFVASQRKELGYFPYSREELALLPPGLENYSMGAYNPCKYADFKNGDKVLDIGCGVGVDLFLAASKVGEKGIVIGVDLTFSLLLRGTGILAGHLGKCKDGNVYPRMLFVQASGVTLPIASKMIDVIISNGCLHLLDKLKAFEEFFRVLRSGGRAILADVVAEDDNIENFYDNPLMYMYSGGGKQTSEQYEYLAKKAGFSEVKFISERQPWDVGDEPMPGGYLILKK